MKSKRKIKLGDTISFRLPNDTDPQIVRWCNNQGSINNSILIAISEIIKAGGLKDLTPDLDPLPSSNEMVQDIFDCIAKGSMDSNRPFGVQLSEIYEFVSNKLGPTDEEINTIPEGKTSLFENRVRWALYKMKSPEWDLIESSKRGFYRVSEFGKFIYNSGISVEGLDKVMEANYIWQKIRNKEETEK
ncbi:MAG TPA: winged helix-turn-helix domain-containing protein [Thermoclostridium sp.]|nr:winged helix-turn-helix domain-containing protein [Thermoclostridium sp.]